MKTYIPDAASTDKEQGEDLSFNEDSDEESGGKKRFALSSYVDEPEKDSTRRASFQKMGGASGSERRDRAQSGDFPEGRAYSAETAEEKGEFPGWGSDRNFMALHKEDWEAFSVEVSQIVFRGQMTSPSCAPRACV